MNGGKKLERVFGVVLVLTAAVASAQPREGVLHNEKRVKAAVVVQLARFVQWPEDAAATSFQLCVVGVGGNDPWFPLLEEASRGQTVGGRPIELRRVEKPPDAEACHLAIVGAAVEPKLLRAILKQPVVTVSEEPGFAKEGGMVGLLVEGGRVVFELNPWAAERKGLRFSSKLIRLARVVGRGE